MYGANIQGPHPHGVHHPHRPHHGPHEITEHAARSIFDRPCPPPPPHCGNDQCQNKESNTKGTLIGGTIGAVIGSVFGPLGTIAGSLLGGLFGSKS